MTSASESNENDDIRAQAKRAATLYDETLAHVQASPVGSVERRLHSALGDLAHVVLSPEEQGHGRIVLWREGDVDEDGNVRPRYISDPIPSPGEDSPS